jgi:hypothetical protein
MADSYSYDMQRLQQDAIRRAREMQARAQNLVAPQQVPAGARPVQNQDSASAAPPPLQTEQTSRTPPREQSPPAHEQHAPVQERTIPVREQQNPITEPIKTLLSPVGDIFESLMKDSDRTLILLLILILVEEKSDPGVIFALMYVIM